MSIVEQVDPEVFRQMVAERDRQQSTLEMIASENHTHPAVLAAASSVLTDKYAEGYPHRRYYGGCRVADDIEQLCIDRAKALFGAGHANVQPHCGTGANLAIYHACLKPGEKILAMDLSCGGHLSHGMPNNASGRQYAISAYSVRHDTERLDMDAVREQALRVRPNLIVCGASSYPRVIDFEAFGRIARECGALLMADIAHIAGLIVGGVHPTPVGHADFVSSTTHKTFRGPRGGLILCEADWAKRIDSAIFPGTQGGPLLHVIAAKAVAFKLCAQPEFKTYAAQIVANAKALSDALAAKGWRIVSGGTDNHLLLIDLRSRDEHLTGHQACEWLEAAGIVCNWNRIPFDPRPPLQASGIRLGTPALTTRGMAEPQMQQIAEWIDSILSSDAAPEATRRVSEGVSQYCRDFPVPSRP